MNLSITLIQTPLYWENPTANRAMFEEKIAQIAPSTNLIVLPEMFSTGFTMNAAALAEPLNLTTTKWLKQMAAQTGAVITGSVIMKEAGNYYNRMLWVEPDGTIDYYNKRHLFRMGGEHTVYEAGTKPLIKHWKGWNIALNICYDLRFPVWSRNLNNAYDLLVNVANFPAARSHHWRTLLTARAIENLSYVVGVNRIGTDGRGFDYSGDSLVLDFKGEILFDAQSEEVMRTVILDKNTLIAYRERFPAYLDADTFEIKN